MRNKLPRPRLAIDSFWLMLPRKQVRTVVANRSNLSLDQNLTSRSVALETFKAAPPSVVILDLRLPGVVGKDVCRIMKQCVPTIPLIMLSATSDVADRVLLLELGADDYVTKPFSPRELLARVRAALRRISRSDSSEVQFGTEVSHYEHRGWLCHTFDRLDFL